MKVTFLGTGVSVPCEKRAQSSILIEEDLKVLVDLGCGAFLRLEELGIQPTEIDAVFITHNHLDHNGDLINLLKARWLMEGEGLHIYAPEGTKNFIESILNAYPYLRGKLKFKVHEEGIFEIGGFKVRALETIHTIESRAYVFEDSLAISGDTRAFPELMAVECEVMIHELSLPFGFKADFHTTPENLKENLSFCKAEKLYLTHLYPMTLAQKDKIIEFLDFNVLIAEDLMSFEV
ncbi:MAG: MBL fold metallo-hydrolase [Archaeoglobaceae archaeon]|nr:MBL fold metallo-hydrolase [Archaeoglobaceae archaeon]MDW8118321.1 MBL fold metallo-hydrolase [Archaeoglobaceae archaeon]